MRLERIKKLVCGSWILLCVLLFFSACASGPTRKTASVKVAPTVKSSPAELQSQNQSLLNSFSSQIETAADQIISESPSSAARRQALIWKADSIPVLQTSLLRTDPLSAVLDTWAFIFQMSAYMEGPPIKQELGDFHAVVAETTKSMDAQMERLVLAAAPSANVADIRTRVKEWADAHPIQAGLSGRQSADPDVIRKVGAADVGSMASLKVLGESLGDIAARLDSYNSFLPKEARWQAEIMLGDVARDPQVGAAMSDIGAASSALARTADTVESMPATVRETRTEMLDSAKAQRIAVQDFLRTERTETLAALQRERVAILAAMRSERLAATQDLRSERSIVLDALRTDAETMMSDFNATSEKALTETEAGGRRLIDHFFLRCLELLLLALLLSTLVAWILLKRFAVKRPVPSERPYERAA